MYLLDSKLINGIRVRSKVRVYLENDEEIKRRRRVLDSCDWSGNSSGYVACTESVCPDIFYPIGCDGFHRKVAGNE